MNIAWNSPVIYAGAAFGAWWALRHFGKLPTVRMVLAVIAGWGATVLVGSYVNQFFGWLQTEAGHYLHGRWAELVPALPVAALLFVGVLVIVSAHPRNAPDRTAEFLAVGLAVLLFAVAGSRIPGLGG